MRNPTMTIATAFDILQHAGGIGAGTGTGQKAPTGSTQGTGPEGQLTSADLGRYEAIVVLLEANPVNADVQKILGVARQNFSDCYDQVQGQARQRSA
jgi:hypothetical protein